MVVQVAMPLAGRARREDVDTPNRGGNPPLRPSGLAPQITVDPSLYGFARHVRAWKVGLEYTARIAVRIDGKPKIEGAAGRACCLGDAERQAAAPAKQVNNANRLGPMLVGWAGA